MDKENVNKYGIDESRKVVTLLADVIENFVGIDSNENGKVEGSEVAEAIFKSVMQAPGAFQNFADLKKEVADLSSEEQVALANHFSEKLDLPIKEVEAIIEDFVIGATRIASGVQKAIKYSKKEK